MTNLSSRGLSLPHSLRVGLDVAPRPLPGKRDAGRARATDDRGADGPVEPKLDPPANREPGEAPPPRRHPVGPNNPARQGNDSRLTVLDRMTRGAEIVSP
jgi:hypothetical protein